MKTITFKVWFECHFAAVSTSTQLTVEVDDDASEKDIEDAKEEAAQAWATNEYSLSHE